MSQVTRSNGPDPVVMVDATSGNETVYLASGFATGRKVTVRRIDNSAYVVTVALANSADTLDGTVNGTATVSGNGEKSFIPYNPGQWESFGGGSTGHLGKYVPSTGVAATDTANIMAAHDAFGVNGGTIVLDAGPYLVTADAVNFTKPIYLKGYGPSGPNVAPTESFLRNGSLIQCNTVTGSAIRVNCDGFHLEGCSIVNISGTTPTAGSAVKIETKGRSFRIVDNDFVGFFINVDVINGYEWYYDRNHNFDAVRYGMQLQDVTLPDGGDGIIANSFFYAGPANLTPTAAIQWRSGGGLKLTGNKINSRGSARWTVGTDFKPSDGISTSVFAIVGNSIEGVNYGIIFEVDTIGSGSISRITVTGNEIATDGISIIANPNVTGRIRNLYIGGNTAGPNNGTVPFVQLKNVDTVDMGPNTCHTTTIPLYIDGGVTNLYFTGLPFTTAGRPAATATRAGASYYDTTLLKPIYSTGSAWKDAAGTTV